MDQPLDLRAVAAARDRFLQAGPRATGGVRDLVVASWQRSRSAGVDADDYRTVYDADLDLDSRLLRCARPVMERLAAEMVDIPVAIALSEGRARIVHRIDCSTSVGRHLDRVDFNQGFSFAEHGVGTNGIGTVFESGQSVCVVGAEHFTQALVRFACTGAPVVDPVTGRVEGVLDVSSLAEDWTPLMHTLVRRAAADIGRALLLDRGRAQQALFEAFVRADSRGRLAVMAVGETLMLNRRAQELVSAAEQQVLHAYGRSVAGRPRRASEVVPVGPGRRLRVRSVPVTAGDDVAGVVLVLEGADDQAAAPPVPAQPARRSPAPVADGRSAGWLLACAGITSALAAREPLLVVGEPGTGRRTLVTELFRRLRPDGVVVEREAAEAAPTGGGLPDGPGLLVLRHLDRLDAARVPALREVLRDAAAGDWLVAATVDDGALGTGLPFEGLLHRFGESVTVPPLRFRPEDLSMAVPRLLRQLAPGRRVRVHPDAMRLLARCPWPANLTGLREALAAALSRRPVGEVRPEDLPAQCHASSTRTLTRIETVERETIVRALADCGGNRARAAALLGMSRSSLYRKLRSYAISEA